MQDNIPPEPTNWVFAMYDKGAKALPFLVRAEGGGWKWWHCVPSHAVTGPGRRWEDVARCARGRLVRAEVRSQSLQ